MMSETSREFKSLMAFPDAYPEWLDLPNYIYLGTDRFQLRTENYQKVKYQFFDYWIVDCDPDQKYSSTKLGRYSRTVVHHIEESYYSMPLRLCHNLVYAFANDDGIAWALNRCTMYCFHWIVDGRTPLRDETTDFELWRKLQ